jgi:hypothetical protein
MSLTSVTRLAIAAEKSVLDIPKAQIISEGVPAQFDGILVPEWQWRKLSAETMAKDLLTVKFEHPVAEPKDNFFKGATFGFLIGSVLVLSLEYFGGGRK